MITSEYIDDKNEFQSEIVKLFKKFMDKYNVKKFNIHIDGNWKRDKNNDIMMSEINFDVTTDIDKS